MSTKTKKTELAVAELSDNMEPIIQKAVTAAMKVFEAELQQLLRDQIAEISLIKWLSFA
jgi:hypothetical protein